jgi:hypothetical protein
MSGDCPHSHRAARGAFGSGRIIMKKAPRIGLGIAAGAGVAALTYGSVAVTAFLRYGKQPALPVTTLAAYIPEPEVSERHRTMVDAAPEIAYAAVFDVELAQSAIIWLIIETRALLMRGRETAAAPPRLFIEQIKDLGWGVLEEAPGREIAFGAVCKPWEGNVTFRAVPAEELAAFAEPGYAKIAWSVTVSRLGGTRALIRTETRVVTTDAESRRRFRRYWAFVSPGVGLIRREMLRLIKRKAERSV